MKPANRPVLGSLVVLGSLLCPSAGLVFAQQQAPGRSSAESPAAKTSAAEQAAPGSPQREKPDAAKPKAEPPAESKQPAGPKPHPVLSLVVHNGRVNGTSFSPQQTQRLNWTPDTPSPVQRGPTDPQQLIFDPRAFGLKLSPEQTKKLGELRQVLTEIDKSHYVLLSTLRKQKAPIQELQKLSTDHAEYRKEVVGEWRKIVTPEQARQVEIAAEENQRKFLSSNIRYLARSLYDASLDVAPQSLDKMRSAIRNEAKEARVKLDRVVKQHYAEMLKDILTADQLREIGLSAEKHEENTP